MEKYDQSLWYLMIPCHRVVRASGELGGYMGMDETGLKVKRWLLDNESAR